MKQHPVNQILGSLEQFVSRGTQKTAGTEDNQQKSVSSAPDHGSKTDPEAEDLHPAGTTTPAETDPKSMIQEGDKTGDPMSRPPTEKPSKKLQSPEAKIASFDEEVNGVLSLLDDDKSPEPKEATGDGLPSGGEDPDGTENLHEEPPAPGDGEDPKAEDKVLETGKGRALEGKTAGEEGAAPEGKTAEDKTAADKLQAKVAQLAADAEVGYAIAAQVFGLNRHAQKQAKFEEKIAADVEHLRSRGYSDNQISEYFRNQGRQGAAPQRPLSLMEKVASYEEEVAADIETAIRQGRLSPDDAVKVAEEVDQELDAEVGAEAIAEELADMVAAGEITPEEAEAIAAEVDAESSGGGGEGGSDEELGAEAIAAELAEMVAAGEITPEEAEAIAAEVDAESSGEPKMAMDPAAGAAPAPAGGGGAPLSAEAGGAPQAGAPAPGGLPFDPTGMSPDQIVAQLDQLIQSGQMTEEQAIEALVQLGLVSPEEVAQAQQEEAGAAAPAAQEGAPPQAAAAPPQAAAAPAPAPAAPPAG